MLHFDDIDQLAKDCKVSRLLRGLLVFVGRTQSGRSRAGLAHKALWQHMACRVCTAPHPPRRRVRGQSSRRHFVLSHSRDRCVDGRRDRHLRVNLFVPGLVAVHVGAHGFDQVNLHWALFSCLRVALLLC